MLNNDVLRSLRFMLNISETQISAWLHEVHCEVGSEQLKSYLSKEDEADFISCPDRVLGHFLDALIIQKRGRRVSEFLCNRLMSDTVAPNRRHYEQDATSHH